MKTIVLCSIGFTKFKGTNCVCEEIQIGYELEQKNNPNHEESKMEKS